MHKNTGHVAVINNETYSRTQNYGTQQGSLSRAKAQLPQWYLFFHRHTAKQLQPVHSRSETITNCFCFEVERFIEYVGFQLFLKSFNII